MIYNIGFLDNLENITASKFRPRDWSTLDESEFFKNVIEAIFIQCIKKPKVIAKRSHHEFFKENPHIENIATNYSGWLDRNEFSGKNKIEYWIASYAFSSISRLCSISNIPSLPILIESNYGSLRTSWIRIHYENDRNITPPLGDTDYKAWLLSERKECGKYWKQFDKNS